MTIKEELDLLQFTLAAKGVHVVRKDQSRFMRFLGVLLFFTKGFMSRFTTTIGRTIYVPTEWDQFPDDAKLEILTHENVHVEQFKRWTLPLAGLAYCLLPFPVGVAWFRYRMERAAYLVGCSKTLERFPERRAAMIDHVVLNLCGSNYGYAWAFEKSVRAWFEKNLPVNYKL